nr:hypothetical protein BaRGS_026016 [Batillaria attramentaria]
MAGCITKFGKTALVTINTAFLVSEHTVIDDDDDDNDDDDDDDDGDVLVSLALTAIGVILKFFSGKVLKKLMDKVVSSYERLEKLHLDQDMEKLEGLPFVDKLGMALMAVGIVLFCISFCACCGATCDLRVLLIVFVILMALLVIVQGVIGGLFLKKDSVLHDKIKETAGKKIQEDYDPKGQDMFSFGINVLNYMLECCGIGGPSDFGKTPSTCCKKDIIDANDTTSAKCVDPTLSKIPEELLNKEGCYDRLQNVVQDHLTIAAVVLAMLLLLQVLEIFFAIAVIKSVGRVGPV